MIRSLVVSHDADVHNNEDLIVGRNFTMEKLVASVETGDLMWLDIIDAEEKEILWLESTFHLHPSVVSDLRSEDRRPALMVYHKYLFLSLFQPSLRLNKIEGKEIHCLIGDNFFITLRHSDAKAVDEAYDRVAQNLSHWRQGVSYFLYLTTQYVLDSYYPLLDRISDQLNTMEENFMSNGGPTKKARKPVYAIKQKLIALRQMVAPQREVVSNVIGEERLTRNGEIRDLFRHLYERLLRIYDVIDAQRDLSTNVLDMIESQENNKMAEAVNRLTVMSMIFLPMTFLTSFFELNIAQASDAFVLPISGGALFLMVVAMMAGSVAVMAYLFKRRGWL
jgi:magnesium transporter